MEVELLKDMIHDRDKRIKLIQLKAEDQSKKLAMTANMLKEVRQERVTMSNKNRVEWEQLQIQKNEIEKRLRRMLEDLRKQQGASSGGTLQSYTNAMTHNPQQQQQQKQQKKQDGANVMRMQAQLCKMMHSMGILDNQMTIVQRTCDSLIKSLKDVLNKQTEEKSLSELELMNELMKADDQRREEIENFKQEEHKFKRQLQQYEDVDDEDSDSEEEEEDEDENDENPEQKEEKVRRVLKETNGEIKELEHEVEEQKDKIRAVKVRLQLRDMQLNGKDDDKDKGDCDSDTSGEVVSDDENNDNEGDSSPEGKKTANTRALSMVAEALEENASERVS